MACLHSIDMATKMDVMVYLAFLDIETTIDVYGLPWLLGYFNNNGCIWFAFTLGAVPQQ
jgi:hypothetical protein